jgi:hypothetical protein
LIQNKTTVNHDLATIQDIEIDLGIPHDQNLSSAISAGIY